MKDVKSIKNEPKMTAKGLRKAIEKAGLVGFTFKYEPKVCGKEDKEETQ